MRLEGEFPGLVTSCSPGTRDLEKNFVSILRAWKSGLLLARYVLARPSLSREVVMFASDRRGCSYKNGALLCCTGCIRTAYFKSEQCKPVI